jgi:hypothetical protein
MNPFIKNEYYKKRNNVESIQHFSNNNPKNQIKNEYCIQQCDFPVLNNDSLNKEELNEKTLLDLSNSFAKIASLQKIEDNNIQNDILKPGWISLQMNKNTYEIEIKNGAKTREMILDERKQGLNYNMYNIINKIENNRLLFEKQYDGINGEGKYEEVYKYYENSMNLCTDSDEDLSDENNENDIEYWDDDF